MKHVTLFKNCMLTGMAALLLFTFSSCGTIAGALSGGKRPAFLVNCPKDVVVKLNGEELDITKELFASTEYIGSTASRNYYTAGLKLPYKKKLTLEFSSDMAGKSGSLQLTPGRYKGIFFLNLLFFPIVGHIIDGVTHNNKVLKPEYIDVISVLNKVPLKDWPSQKKLKRIEKSKAKKSKR